MAITVEKLPAERGAGAAPIAAAGGCCCCCCCCLHTVGSIIGAVTAHPPKQPVDDMLAPPTAVVGTTTAEPKYTVWREYWISTLLLCTVAFPLLFLRDVDAKDLTVPAMLLAFAMILPAVQLGASVVTFVITTTSKRPGKSERLQHLSRITLRAFVGALIGLAMMLPLLTMC